MTPKKKLDKRMHYKWQSVMHESRKVHRNKVSRETRKEKEFYKFHW